ncbi:MAG TPA: DUF2012 domain-containing protein, partial [Armatimonadota bacterium]|nr:DUF2012 domain-containing protein [Armatimonadota bacterium]
MSGQDACQAALPLRTTFAVSPETGRRVECAENEILIVFRSGARASLMDRHRALGSAVLQEVRRCRIQAVRTPPGMTVEAAIQLYQRMPEVALACPNSVLRGTATPNDPSYPSQWWLPRIDAPAAWDYGTVSAVPIAIIDSGVDPDHPDLNGNRWINAGEVAGNGIDDDGNGYVDDVHGWDFIDDDNTPWDVDGGTGHGTCVMGCIAAVGNNATGVTGTCWRARVGSIRALGSDGKGVASDVIAGIEYATATGFRIINMSLGGDYTSAFDTSIAAAYNAGILIVAAAGNDGVDLSSSPRSPVCNDGPANWVLGVAATNSSDTRASFSNYATAGSGLVDLSAPGQSVLTTGYVPGPGNATATASGTSFSSPIAAGAGALVMTRHGHLSNREVRDLLCGTSDAISDRSLGAGRLNMASAVGAVYSITGTVTAGGVGLEGVSLTADDGAGHVGGATTAADGTFIIADLPPGAYVVTPHKVEYTFSPSSMLVTIGPDATGKDFAGTRNTYVVSGTVRVGADPLAGVVIDAGGGRAATTAADGTYSLSGLVAGTYTLTPSKAEYTFAPGALEVTVGPDVAGQDFAATVVTYTIRGTVTSAGKALSGVVLTADDGAGHVGTATTGADGKYIVSDLVAGTYTLTPTKPEYTFTPVHSTVNLGPSISGEDFNGTLVTYSMSGRVTATGAGLAGVTVTVDNGAGGVKTATTTSNGTWSLSGLLAGTYTVTPAKAQYTFTPETRSVLLGPSATAVDFEADLVTYSISGTIRLNGQGLPGVEIVAGPGRTAITGPDGTYTVTGLLAGTHRVTPSMAEHAFDPPWLNVTVGPDATGQDFSARIVTYSISGTISSGGVGLGGVIVEAGGQTAVSQASGAYTITGLPAGTYNVTPASDDFVFDPPSAAVAVGPSVTDVNFTGDPRYRISGTVTAHGVPVAGVTVDAGGGHTAIT